MNTEEGPSWKVVALVSILALPVIVWEGFVASKIWSMFLVPLGLPDVGVLQAAGIVVLVAWMTGAVSVDLNKLDELAFQAVAEPLIMWIMCIALHSMSESFPAW